MMDFWIIYKVVSNLDMSESFLPNLAYVSVKSYRSLIPWMYTVALLYAISVLVFTSLQNQNLLFSSVILFH